MTRHPRSNYYFTTSTKEQKVITTGQHANAASTPKTGLSATLRGLLGFTGISAPKMTKGSGLSKISASHQASQTFIALCALVGAFAFATAAQAEPPRLVPDGSFSPGPRPLGVAVDNSGSSSAGDVYTGAFSESSINKFNSSGKLISPPSPFGNQFTVSMAVNPANGDLSVLNLFGTVETYEPDGTPVGSPFTVEGSHNFFENRYTLVRIGVDSKGDVYVPVARREASPPTEPPKYEPNDEVLEYPPGGCESAAPPCPKVFTGGSGKAELKEPTGVTVGSSGNLWVADHGDNRIVELNPSGAPVEVNGKPVEIASEGVESVALDGRGDVLAIVRNSADFCGTLAPPCPHLVEYDSAGVQVADVGAGSFEPPPLGFPPMVAVNEATGRVYVSDLSNELVWIFAPPLAPVVDKELAAEVGVSEAKLGALVSPGGIGTTYRFEYLSEAAFQADNESFSGPERAGSVPFPEGSVGEGFASRTVWAAAAGLQPGTTYHYRIVATNELAPAGVTGPNQTFTTQTAKQASCSNEQLRGGFSARLPDCRAYELVTPSTKTTVQVEGGTPAADGEAIPFGSKEPLPGAPTSGNNYIATRSEGDWKFEDMDPLESYTGIVCPTHSASVPAFSDDPSKALVVYGRASRSSEPEREFLETECNAEGLQVTSGEPVGYENLLLRDDATGAYQLVNVPPPGVTPADAHFEGASTDLSHIVFSELAPLTPGAPAGDENLYEWDQGALRLLTAEGALAGASNGSPAISKTGSHIVLTVGGGLYVRVDGSSTVQVDASQIGGAGGGGSFQAMSAEGSAILFTDESRLTQGSTATPNEPDLYECVLPEGASRCELSDLTVAKAGEHADVLTVSRLGSQDSSHVYFVAKGVLAEGATSGENNLYVYEPDPEHEGQFKTKFIATLVAGDQGVGAVSPDGSWFAFDSVKSLTGYDNVSSSGEPVEEIFLYDATSGQLTCASCNPSGEAPIPGAGALLPPFAQRPLADGGRLFFETREALVPADTNNQVDVYEYEDGQPALISSGTGRYPSKFVGASESGGDAFFESSQELVPRDTEEELRVIYDARVGGGFAEPSPPPACTTADACRVPVAPLPAVFGAPASATFSGAGNLAPPSPAVVKPKPKTAAQLKAGKLAKALKTCRKEKSKKRRASCEASAQKKYGVAKPRKKQNKAKKSAHINRRAPR